MPIVISEVLSVVLPPPQNWRRSAVMDAELPRPVHAALGRKLKGSRLKLMKLTVVLLFSDK